MTAFKMKQTSKLAEDFPMLPCRYSNLCEISLWRALDPSGCVLSISLSVNDPNASAML